VGRGAGLGRFVEEKKLSCPCCWKEKYYRRCVSHYILVKKLLKQESQKSLSTEMYSLIENGNFSDKKRKLFQIMV